MPEASPLWPECAAPVVQEVAHYSDLELLQAFQRQPQVARYFIALFCRYCAWVDGILAEHLPPEQWAACREQVWLQLYPRLQRLDAHSLLGKGVEEKSSALRLWLAEQTRRLIPSFAGIPGNCPPTLPGGGRQPLLSPALACYLVAGLDSLPGDKRFILLLQDRFGWSPAHIAAQLKADGYHLAPEDVDGIVVAARQLLLRQLPADVRDLYLAAKP